MGLPSDRRLPAASRLDSDHPLYDEIVARHEAAIDSGSPTYLDPAHRLVVFTAAFLWNRGVCCESGCRHCPFVTPR